MPEEFRLPVKDLTGVVMIEGRPVPITIMAPVTLIIELTDPEEFPVPGLEGHAYIMGPSRPTARFEFDTSGDLLRLGGS